jgi:hypothetical protein
MEARKQKDERMFLGVPKRMMLLLIGLVAFGGAPVLVSTVVVLHTGVFVCMYVFIYVL